MGLINALRAVRRKSEDVYVAVLNNKEISDEFEVVFRLPSTKRAQQYQALLSCAETHSDRNLIYESVFREVIDDEFLSKAEDVPAGLPESIAKTVLLLSGTDSDTFAYTEILFSQNRTYCNSIHAYMQRVICSVFSSYSFEDLDKLSYPRMVYVFIQAEKFLIEKGIITAPYEFTGKESEEELKKKARRKVFEDIKQDMAAQRAFARPESQQKAQSKNSERIREMMIEKAKREEMEYHNSIERK